MWAHRFARGPQFESSDATRGFGQGLPGEKKMWSARSVGAALPTATAIAAAVLWARYQHRRIRRAKNCMRAVRIYPPPGITQRAHPLIFLTSSSQKADVWRSRMELLAAAGYECHALDFTQTGRYFTSYAEQLSRLRQYIVERVEGRPVLIGHGQGGAKAQLYLLADGCDAVVPPENRLRAVILMASCEASILSALPGVLCKAIATAGVARTALAALLGGVFLDPVCFLAGGGPLRHRIRAYEGLFCSRTCRTTQTSAHGHSDARVALNGGEGGGGTDVAIDVSVSGLPLAAWADTYLAAHDPFITDFGCVGHARTPREALEAHACAMLHLVAAEDRVMPRVQSDKVTTMWQCSTIHVEGQGHQFGDAGWEQSVMRPLRDFLDAL